MSTEIFDLAGENCCPVNKPGVQQLVHFIPSCDVEDFPELPAFDPQDPGASVILPSDIVVKTGKNWYQILTIVDTGTLRSEAQGNIGSKGFRNETQIDMSGASAEQLAWWNQVINGCFIAVVEDKNGRKRVIGNPKSPAHFDTIEHTINSEDSKGMGLLYDKAGHIAPIYEGSLSLDPAA